SPAVMPDPLDPGHKSRVFVVAAVDHDQNPNTAAVLKLFRIDVAKAADGTISAAVDGRSPTITSAHGSDTSPTISQDGTAVYIVGDDRKLYAFSAETCALLWSRDVGGSVLGSVSVGRGSPHDIIVPVVSQWNGNSYVLGSKLLVINKDTGGNRYPPRDITLDFQDKLDQYLDPLDPNIPRGAIITINVLASPTDLSFIVTLAYDVRKVYNSQKTPPWPMKSLFVSTNYQGVRLGNTTEVLGDAEVPLVLSDEPAGNKVVHKLLATNLAYEASIAHCLWRHPSEALAAGANSNLLNILGSKWTWQNQPMQPVGGFMFYKVRY
ncbi:MAG: hypothetical protein V1794_01520, partial [Candidatus Glassbacteria bacterium]